MRKDNRRQRRTPFVITLAVAAAALLVAPTAITVWQAEGDAAGYRSIALDGPLAVSFADVISAPDDPTGLVSIASTLVHWRNATVDAARITQTFETAEATMSQAEVRDAFAALGFDAQWFEADVAALARLKRPFLAALSEDVVRLVMVRDVRQGILYVFDPRRGNVIIEAEDLATTYAGVALVFADPPQPRSSGATSP